MVAANVTIATVECEMPGILAYAGRHDWTVDWDASGLRIMFTGRHLRSGAPVCIVASVDGYRELPPAWTFLSPSGSSSAFFPKPANLRSGRGSIFHNTGRICAPFNRDAYKSEGGPHSDWGGPVQWLEVRTPGQVYATSIAEMFAVIFGHLQASPEIRR